ncbi:hypothetical protein [Paraburkholderia sp. ZP32-5]|uniref:hypothetical protein n=1 Tax=Paraburkholderia sp. ZP32-5 TaxID=2883245 RepID=UPI001F305A63|nr:hypothetical protein [Paraburkholderia sp. ZP32-5]
MGTTDDENNNLAGNNSEPASVVSTQPSGESPAGADTTNAQTSSQGKDDLGENDPEPAPSAVPPHPSAEAPAGVDAANGGPSPQAAPEYARVLDASDPTPASLIAFSFDSKRHHDEARSTIAYWLLALLTGLLVATALGFGSLLAREKPPTFDDFKSLVELILTPLLTLVSAATGFYFGSQKQES